MFPLNLSHKLNERIKNNSFRKLNTNFSSIDFASNDYLGFSTQGILFEEVNKLQHSKLTGSTGSRLISGNSTLFNEVENNIAIFHNAESALIFNSGYDANVGLLSSVPQKGDLILYDELIHASLIDGIKLSYATAYKFKHNHSETLQNLIERYKNTFNEIYIVVESIYSMDGDSSPLKEIAKISKENNCHLIVDEAHAIGVFGDNGKGICHVLNIEKECFARIYTYGKAMGCHGAAIVGSTDLKNYLINFARSFIYTTAMTEHGLLLIQSAYNLLLNTTEIQKLKLNITYFKKKLNNTLNCIESQSAIQCIVKPGNETIQQLENNLMKNNFFVKAIKSPTVKINQERMRICLHSFNTHQQIDELINVLIQN